MVTTQPLLTLDDVRQLKAAVDESRRLMDVLQVKLSGQEKRLEAACVFLPDDAKSLIFGAKQTISEAPVRTLFGVEKRPKAKPKGRKQKPDTWQASILAVLSNADRGLTHRAILEQLKRSPIGNRVVRSTKAYYNGITRLTGTGKIERHGDLIYSLRLANEIRGRGDAIPTFDPAESDHVRGKATSAGLILRALREEGRGLTGAELLDRLSLIPEAPPSLLKHKQFIYTVLAKMVRDEEIIKEGPVYILNVPVERAANGASALREVRH